jgi:hypothetical protein
MSAALPFGIAWATGLLARTGGTPRAGHFLPPGTSINIPKFDFRSSLRAK